LASAAAPGEVRASGATRDLCARAGPRFVERDCLDVDGFGPLRAYTARPDTGGTGKGAGDD
jgi:class 3 adenylate cyclase